jgi:uncharacterized membrane protein
MMPLIVLVGSFILLLAVHRLFRALTFERAGRIAFSVMLLFTGSSHFYLTEGMVMSMPSIFPAKEALVYLTGALEIAFALAFILVRNTRPVAWVLIAFLVAVFPANVYAALNQVDIENATYDGPGLSYLLFRGPLQLFFMAWVYYFGIHKPAEREVKYYELRVVPPREGRVDVVEMEEKESGQSHYWD